MFKVLFFDATLSLPTLASIQSHYTIFDIFVHLIYPTKSVFSKKKVPVGTYIIESKSVGTLSFIIVFTSLSSFSLLTSRPVTAPTS